MYRLLYFGVDLDPKNPDNILHDPRKGIVATDITCTLQVNSAASLKFTISKSNQWFGRMEARSATHEVALLDDDEYLFRGRIIEDAQNIKTQCSFTCEGQLSYLNDSIVRPYGTYSDTSKWDRVVPASPNEVYRWLISQHNSQMDLSKRFEIGDCEITPKENSLTASSTTYPTTSNEIKDKILDDYNCYLIDHFRNGTRFLDLTLNGYGLCEQSVEFGTNITDFSTTQKVDDIITCIIPFGKDSDNNTFGISSFPDQAIDEKYVKEGDHVYNSEGVERYGKIVKQISYDSCSTVNALIGAAKNDLESSSYALESLSVSAIDLHAISSDIKPIRLGEWVRVISKPHNVDQNMMCVKIDINVNNPEETKYTFGSTLATLTNSNIIKASQTRKQITQVIVQTQEISDTAKAAAKEATGATTIASEAKTLAASKSTNYTSQPTPPYNVGDTWTDLTNNIVYTCYTSRLETEEFNKSDWCETGKAGKDAALVCVVSRNGEAFKNNEVETTLDVTIFYGGKTITTKTELSNSFGSAVSLKWLYCPKGSKTYYELSSTDSRLSNDGFTLVISPSDVDQQIVFRCELDDGK